LGRAIDDNRGMGRLWLPLAIVGLLITGCASKSEPSAPAPGGSTSATEQPAGTNEPAHRWRDDFNLPLVIEIAVPDVPPEIQKPSPPIKEEAKPR
jgi:hypothetical protein